MKDKENEPVVVVLSAAISAVVILLVCAAAAVVVRSWGFENIEWWHPAVLVVFARIAYIFVVGGGK